MGDTPLSPAHSRTAIYSYTWAANIIVQARRSHLRGWKIFDSFSGLTDRQLAFLVASNSPEWPVIRRIVHTLDNWEDQQARFGPSRLVWNKEMIKRVIRISDISQEKLKKYLTSRLDSLD